MSGFEAILEQYDSSRGLQFYQTIMGGGETSIHYGIYQDSDDIKTATENIMRFMAECIQRHTALSQSKVLDLGSGTGSAAHFLVKNYDCEVVCVNISPNQNKLNQQKAAELKILDSISIVNTSFDNLPDTWNEKFDIVWSEEAFCHGSDKLQIIRESKRVLKENGSLIFTDIMAGEGVSQTELDSFTSKNAVTQLARPSDYFKWCLDAGFKEITYFDLSHHLKTNFKMMIDRIDNNYSILVKSQVPENYLNEFKRDLHTRVNEMKDNKLSWGCFYTR
ncbi:methyltransferase domain-containing protein [Oscillatoriales cyanobacterium LEGE 11467]|uniref:Methyltransferase domain-containing protein n=1 Tax=Zarconia navalis LEGE 11467 TaxID=1828826 RepID=A0A928VX64_9CYAN|nr:class I SAM-dependent methyltransferase [Zarconia navalis]MBE9039793.1 methyltransferase domain-containing protein [Zarconia navalis LEGE 11467]